MYGAQRKINSTQCRASGTPAPKGGKILGFPSSPLTLGSWVDHDNVPPLTAEDEKSDNSAQCCLESNMSNASLEINLQWLLFFIFIPNKYLQRLRGVVVEAINMGFSVFACSPSTSEYSQSGVDQWPVQGVFREFVAVNRKRNENLTTA